MKPGKPSAAKTPPPPKLQPERRLRRAAVAWATTLAVGPLRSRPSELGAEGECEDARPAMAASKKAKWGRPVSTPLGELSWSAPSDLSDGAKLIYVGITEMMKEAK